MEAPQTPGESSRWFWIAAIWTCIGLFNATQTVFGMRAVGMDHAWTQLYITQLLSWLPWALATPFVLRLGRRYSAAQLRSLPVWVAHLATWTAISLVSSAWLTLLEVSLNPWKRPPSPDPFLEIWASRFYTSIFSSLVLYSTILLVSYLINSRERLARHQTETARLNEQLLKAQLSALRRQIEPHFLFNTLNAIAGLVRENRNDAAVSMIAGLSDFLRRVVEDSDRHEVPLAEEVEFARKYLDIQKVRFADRLRVSADVPEELSSAQVPSLILQPMVENAIKHGIAKRVQGGAIRISALRSNGQLTLRVYNDGPGLADDWEYSHSGTGIANVRTRLHSLYGEAFQLSMKNQTPDGVEVTLSVPFRE